ncbi:hypothetical protein [Rhizobium sp. 18055]|jgi:hypothetical protein|uniref:hypothetical protein n=1 Tax=Rhizobium sp. 18055 TaxID=2681403 RepID=UPI0013596B85|nr:hypothetical protein [Rhizobium sp. 18055]
MMPWKSERKRSITFRKRRLRDEAFAWNMQPYRETGPRVMTCMALVMPTQRGSGLDRLHNWVVLVSTEGRQGYQRVKRSADILDEDDSHFDE